MTKMVWRRRKRFTMNDGLSIKQIFRPSTKLTPRAARNRYGFKRSLLDGAMDMREYNERQARKGAALPHTDETAGEVKRRRSSRNNRNRNPGRRK